MLMHNELLAAQYAHVNDAGNVTVTVLLIDTNTMEVIGHRRYDYGAYPLYDCASNTCDRVLDNLQCYGVDYDRLFYRCNILGDVNITEDEGEYWKVKQRKRRKTGPFNYLTGRDAEVFAAREKAEATENNIELGESS